ncbi:MAG TPA: isoleucine--tRNA ligase [Pyrinomonadaceae bacterium]|jgi:isoleucyl-tRNA synthetase
MTDSLDLKKTVNLPKTNFSQKANLAQSEPARLAKWKQASLYELIRESRKNAEKFILHDGPPYANADIHIGTALNKILKDFIVKSRTMMGFDAPYVPGYDCHGLPIEQHVERKLAEKGKNKVDIPTKTFRRICRDHASTAMNSQTRDFQRLGVFGEWENPYLTMSHEYEAETARLFGKFLERGFVYKGARPVYWCIHDQTALAEAEVEYKLHTSPSVYVRFPLKGDGAQIDEALAGKKVNFVIWTTTPWTLPSNLGIAVNPDFEYAAVENGDEVLIIASELVGFAVVKCGLGGVDENGERQMPNILAKFPGSKLEGLWARHPWINRDSLLMNGDHVTLGGESDAETELDVSEARDRKETSKAGTGLVHTAPGHGHDDFLMGKKYGLEIYCPVDNAGRFTPEVENFAGETVFQANPKIVDFLQANGSLLFSEKYEHRYPHCWRCKNPVIFRATPQWFISMDAGENGSLRRMALNEIKNVNWLPAWGEDRMRNMVSGRPDWCVSRQRVWGVPIPVFYCAGCEREVATPEIVNHVADIFRKETADAWYEREASELLPEGFTCGECGSTEFRKESDILDVWFDSGSSCVAVLETRDNLEFPADVYIEGGDQYRGWFNSSLMLGLAAHNRAPYKNVLTHGWVVDGEGRKQSKSVGNTTPPDEIIKQSGAEILRLWASAVDYTEDVRCSGEILQRVTDAYRKIRNTMRFALGNLDGFNPETDAIKNPILQYSGGKDVEEIEELLEIDRWALGELDAVTEKVLAGYQNFDFQAVYHTLYNFCTVTLSARYFDIIKDRLYTAAPRSHARRSAQTALYKIADVSARLLAPVLAFTADEIWENLPGQTEASVHIARFPQASGKREEMLSERWERLFSVRDIVLKKLEEARNEKLIGSSLEAKVVLETSGDLLDLLRQYAHDLRFVFIVSQVELKEADNLHVRIVKAEGEKCERCWNYSTQVGESDSYPTVCERCAPVLAEIQNTENAAV